MIPKLDRRKLVAFGLSGALGTVVIYGASLGDSAIAVSAGAFFAISALAISAFNPLVVVSAAWAAALILGGLVMAVADNPPGAVIVGAVSLGTAAVAVWTAVGFLALLLLDPSRRHPVA